MIEKKKLKIQFIISKIIDSAYYIQIEQKKENESNIIEEIGNNKDNEIKDNLKLKKNNEKNDNIETETNKYNKVNDNLNLEKNNENEKNDNTEIEIETNNDKEVTEKIQLEKDNYNEINDNIDIERYNGNSKNDNTQIDKNNIREKKIHQSVSQTTDENISNSEPSINKQNNGKELLINSKNSQNYENLFENVKISVDSSSSMLTCQQNDRIIIQNHYSILKFIEILDNNQNKKKELNTADFITQVENYFISGGTNQYLNLFNNNYFKEKQINNLEEWKWVYNIFSSSKKTKKESSIEIRGCSKNTIFSFTINYFKKPSESLRIKSSPKTTFLIEGNNNEVFCCKEDQLTIYTDFESIIIKGQDTNIEEYKDKLLKSAIKISNSLIFKSNKIVSKGEDRLFFFGLTSKKGFKTNIDNLNYSFIYSPNGLTFIELDEQIKNDLKEKIRLSTFENNPNINISKNKSKNGVLLCACKKYLKSQINGILLILFEDNKNISNNCNFIDFKFKCTNDNRIS